MAKGYRYIKDTGRYQASICIKGICLYLGLYNTAEEATGAYEYAKNRYKDNIELLYEEIPLAIDRQDMLDIVEKLTTGKRHYSVACLSFVQIHDLRLKLLEDYNINTKWNMKDYMIYAIDG